VEPPPVTANNTDVNQSMPYYDPTVLWCHKRPILDKTESNQSTETIS